VSGTAPTISMSLLGDGEVTCRSLNNVLQNSDEEILKVRGGGGGGGARLGVSEGDGGTTRRIKRGGWGDWRWDKLVARKGWKECVVNHGDHIMGGVPQTG